MQRDEAGAPAAIEVTEEEKPAISLEELSVAASTGPSAATGAAVAKAAIAAAPALRTARVVAVSGRKAMIAFRGAAEPIEAEIAAEVERELVEEAAAERDAVLVEIEGDRA